MAWGAREPTTPVVKKTAVVIARYFRRMYPRLLRRLHPRNLRHLRLPPSLRHHHCSCHRISRLLTKEAGKVAKVVKAAMTNVEAAAEVAGESKEVGAAGELSWMACAMRESTTPVVFRRLRLQIREARTCGKRQQAAAAVIAAYVAVAISVHPARVSMNRVRTTEARMAGSQGDFQMMCLDVRQVLRIVYSIQ